MTLIRFVRAAFPAALPSLISLQPFMHGYAAYLHTCRVALLIRPYACMYVLLIFTLAMSDQYPVVLWRKHAVLLIVGNTVMIMQKIHGAQTSDSSWHSATV
jgi:hypothetical protein